MPVNFINAFVVPSEQDEAFLASWRKTSAALGQKPGFLETHLYKNTGQGGKEFLYVNIARWNTAEDLLSANPKSVSDAGELPGVKAHPEIFEEVVALR